jgi:CRISPR-associated protein Cas2
MTRRHYLVSYDISDDKRRNRVFETLKDHGDHIQYSVFLCQLSTLEVVGLRGRLDEIIHHGQDQVLLVDLGPGHLDLQTSIEALGQAFSFSTKAFII